MSQERTAEPGFRSIDAAIPHAAMAVIAIQMRRLGVGSLRYRIRGSTQPILTPGTTPLCEFAPWCGSAHRGLRAATNTIASRSL